MTFATSSRNRSIFLALRRVGRTHNRAQHCDVVAAIRRGQRTGSADRIVDDALIRALEDHCQRPHTGEALVEALHAQIEHLCGGLFAAHTRGLARLGVHVAPARDVAVEHPGHLREGLARALVPAGLERILDGAALRWSPGGRGARGSAVTNGALIAGQPLPADGDRGQQREARERRDPLAPARGGIAAERREQIAHRGEAVVELGRQAAEQDLADPSGHVAVLGRVGQPAFENIVHHRDDVVAGEGPAPVETFVERD